MQGYGGALGQEFAGFPGGPGGRDAGMASPEATVQAAQMAAMQQRFPSGGYGMMYPPYPGAGALQGGAASGSSPGYYGGACVPGGGAPDGGLSAAYAAWYGGGAGYGGGGFGGAKGSDSGEKGKGGDFKGKGKGKGKGKSWKGAFAPSFGGNGDTGFGGSESWTPPGDPRRQIELAQRRAKLRDRSAISQAQRSAQQRFEKDLLDRVQGSWIDESDNTTSYVVEGSLCSVSGGENSRVFRNRIGVYGGELCWDARRFWHYLDLIKLPPAGEEVERVEWTPGEGSPPTRPIIWLRGEPPLKIGDAQEEACRALRADGEEGDGDGEVAELEDKAEPAGDDEAEA